MTSAIQSGLDKSDGIDVVETHLENFKRAEEATEVRRERFLKEKGSEKIIREDKTLEGDQISIRNLKEGGNTDKKNIQERM